jgi:hypothetical protein
VSVNPSIKINESPTSVPNAAYVSNNHKKKKPFVERVGDWNCFKCKNLNFSFRVICNRCQLTKKESEKLSENIMKTNNIREGLLNNNSNLTETSVDSC